MIYSARTPEAVFKYFLRKSARDIARDAVRIFGHGLARPVGNN